MMENKKPYKVKKAFIDQLLLVLFLFFSLLAIGATISDNMQARDKYYNLKKVTDNSALTLAKYYNTHLEYDTIEEEDRVKTEATTVNYDMLKETKLGNEVKDAISYTWNLDTDPKTVIVSISNYKESTFWLRLLGLDTLDINVESIVELRNINISTGFAPFAINDEGFEEGDSDIILEYEITADWNYGDKTTFYPIYVDCDCKCQFMLNDKFEYTNFIDLEGDPIAPYEILECASGETSCKTHGESEFQDYAKTIIDIYEDKELTIDFENPAASTPICLLGTYLGNDKSTWGTQINHLSHGIQDLMDAHGPTFEMDLLTLGTDAKANGITRVKVKNFEYKKTGPDDDKKFVKFTVDFIKTIEKVNLTDRSVKLVE